MWFSQSSAIMCCVSMLAASQAHAHTLPASTSSACFQVPQYRSRSAPVCRAIFRSVQTEQFKRNGWTTAALYMPQTQMVDFPRASTPMPQPPGVPSPGTPEMPPVSPPGIPGSPDIPMPDPIPSPPGVPSPGDIPEMPGVPRPGETSPGVSPPEVPAPGGF